MKYFPAFGWDKDNPLALTPSAFFANPKVTTQKSLQRIQGGWGGASRDFPVRQGLWRIRRKRSSCKNSSES